MYLRNKLILSRERRDFDDASGLKLRLVSPGAISTFLLIFSCLVPIANADEPSVTPADETTLEKIAARDSGAMVYIKADYFDNKTGSRQAGTPGSGFIISKEGYVLTATHVIKDWLLQSDEEKREQPLFGRINSRFASEIAMRVVSADIPLDVALLRFADQSKTYQPVSVCLDPDLHLGQKIYALGFPNDHELSSSPGVFNNDNNNAGLIEGTLAVDPGMSGGPVYNDKGVAIGMVEGGVALAEATKFIVPLRWVRSLLLDRTSAKPACSRDAEITPVSAKYDVPNPEAFCRRLLEVQKASSAEFKPILGKPGAYGIMTPPKISLPSTQWCSVDQLPPFSGQKARAYYSCMFFSDEKNPAVAFAKFDAYSSHIASCLGRKWVGGDVQKEGSDRRRSFTPDTGGNSIDLQTSTGRDGIDLVIHIN